MNAEAPTHIPAEPKEVFTAALAGVAAAFLSRDATPLLGADDMLQQLHEAQVQHKHPHGSLPLNVKALLPLPPRTAMKKSPIVILAKVWHGATEKGSLNDG
jgi:hypothetical protein